MIMIIIIMMIIIMIIFNNGDHKVMMKIKIIKMMMFIKMIMIMLIMVMIVIMMSMIIIVMNMNIVTMMLLPGLTYITEDGRHVVEHLLWSFLFCCAVGLMITFMIPGESSPNSRSAKSKSDYIP